jgi:hypothetical protein
MPLALLTNSAKIKHKLLLFEIKVIYAANILLYPFAPGANMLKNVRQAKHENDT